MNSNNRIAATLYSLVCLRNVSINTLHKGDDDDDDNNNNNNKSAALDTHLQNLKSKLIVFCYTVLLCKPTSC